jgi:hypothetical protein
MRTIKILRTEAYPWDVSMYLDHKEQKEVRSVMKSEFPTSHTPHDKPEEPTHAESRFIDEKVSDESGFETTADKALAPAGLNNPFWN